jgi:mono/diheme cytochrome c family protein
MTTLRALAKLACTLVLGVACRGGARDSGAPAARALASTGPAVSAPAAPALAVGDPARGHELVVAYQCSRCHEGSGTPAPGREQHCVTCHQDIEQGKLHAPAAVLARWRPHVAPVDAVPSLVAAGRRLRADWLRAFLLEPSDVRPALAPTMPRLALSAAQAADIAAYLASLGAPAPPSAARG